MNVRRQRSWLAVDIGRVKHHDCLVSQGVKPSGCKKLAEALKQDLGLHSDEVKQTILQLTTMKVDGIGAHQPERMK